jgi:hypothetical protein
MKKFLTTFLLLLTFVTPALAVRPKKSRVRHASTHVRQTSVPKKHKKHSKWNVLFWPSRLSLILQNKEIDDNNISRLEDQKDLNREIASGELVPIEQTRALAVDKRLDPKRRYCRPWTMDFLRDLSEKFYAEFGQHLMVDSAVRPKDVQKKLRRRNRNAAPIEGETASSHMAGLTIDLARGYMSTRQVHWMEWHLLILHVQGLVEVEEEHHQLCFHIMVAKKYGDPTRIQVETLPVEIPDYLISDISQ